jgi:hypothetical protein
MCVSAFLMAAERQNQKFESHGASAQPHALRRSSPPIY